MSTILFSWSCTDEFKTMYLIVCYNYTGEWWTRNITDIDSCIHLEQHVEEKFFKGGFPFACMVSSFNGINSGPLSSPVNTTFAIGMLVNSLVSFQILQLQ